MDEIPAAFEETPFVCGDTPRDLLYLGFIGMWRDPGDLTATALDTDKDQHKTHDQAAQRQFLHCERLSPCKDRHVRWDEVRPRGRTLSLWRGWDTVTL